MQLVMPVVFLLVEYEGELLQTNSALLKDQTLLLVVGLEKFRSELCVVAFVNAHLLLQQTNHILLLAIRLLQNELFLNKTV